MSRYERFRRRGRPRLLFINKCLQFGNGASLTSIERNYIIIKENKNVKCAFNGVPRGVFYFMAFSVQAPKGTHDVLPDEVAKWQYVEGVLRKCAEDFGFYELRFPTIEHTELFLRGVGDTTDVVQKEMYTFEDKGGRSITLRPEGTASVVRCFVEHGLASGALPFKCYYIAPNFRYEKPQAGRLREHHQFGVEVFGSREPIQDAEVIGLADTFLSRLGIRNIRVHINSIGCPVCRKDYYAKLLEYLNGRRAELCDTCLSRMDKNPMRVLDCKCPSCKAVAANAPRCVDYLCEECRTHFESVQRCLTDMGIDYELDSGIVRGLDYYTKTVFEFVSENIGAQGTVCGGGRYDGLVREIGGPDMPGLGFGSGIERLLMVMESLGILFPEAKRSELFLACAEPAADLPVQRLVHALRKEGISCQRDTCARSLKAQMKYADKLGARFVSVIGGRELEEGRTSVKNMATGETETVELTPESLAAFLQR